MIEHKVELSQPITLEQGKSLKEAFRETVESCLRENSGHVKSFVVVLNFVDFVGSERVAQTHEKGKTLEEGCHINISFLTLTKVIRKLRTDCSSSNGWKVHGTCKE